MREYIRYRSFITEKTRAIAREGTVLDVGGGKPFTKWLGEYKDLFAGCDYRTFDYDESTGADVVGDIHQIPLPDNSVDGIICHSVLEHVSDPRKAVEEMRRILRPGGKLFAYVPSIYPYHARRGHYPDLWRFFEDTLRLLFRDFSTVEIRKRGGYFTALSNFVPGQARLRWILDPLAEALDRLLRTDRRTTTAGYFVFLVK